MQHTDTTTNSERTAQDLDSWFRNLRAQQANRDLRVANRIAAQADEVFEQALANAAEVLGDDFQG